MHQGEKGPTPSLTDEEADSYAASFTPAWEAHEPNPAAPQGEQAAQTPKEPFALAESPLPQTITLTPPHLVSTDLPVENASHARLESASSQILASDESRERAPVIEPAPRPILQQAAPTARRAAPAPQRGKSPILVADPFRPV